MQLLRQLADFALQREQRRVRLFQRQQLAFDDLSQLHLLAQRIVGSGVVASAAQLIIDLRQASAGWQGVILLRQAALQLRQAQRAAGLPGLLRRAQRLQAAFGARFFLQQGAQLVFYPQQPIELVFDFAGLFFQVFD